jgi:hypothetical protein
MGAAAGFREHYIPVTEADEWRAALKGVPHAFAHTVECCAAIQLTTGWPTFLYVAACAGGRVVCPLTERTYGGFVDVVTPYQFSGFSITGAFPDVARRWREFAERRGFVCAYIAQHPALTDPLPDADEVAVRNTLYLLDLTLSADELLRRFDRNRRRQLRHYATDSVALVVERETLGSFLVSNYSRFVTRVGAPAASRLADPTLARLARLPNVTIVGIEAAGRIEAVYLFGHTEWAGDCLLNVATAEGRRHATTLLWSGVLALKALQVPLLNLGGGPRQDDPVARSKERFRARGVPFRSRRQIFRRDVYEALCLDAGIEDPGRATYFPAYRSAL